MFLYKFKIAGHSMQPSINNGQTVLASPIPYLFRKPGIGDIVAFKYEDKILIKKIKAKKNDGFIVEGENKIDSLDSKVLGLIFPAQIVAKVIYKF